MHSHIAGLLVVAFLAANVLSQQSATGSEKKATYAVVSLKCGGGVGDGDGELISDRLREEIFNTNLVNVMEREQMQNILKEQEFQKAGATCPDDACLMKLGQLLGVQIVVTGSLGKQGPLYIVNIRAIDVQTGKTKKTVSIDVRGELEQLVDLLPRLAAQLTGRSGR